MANSLFEKIELDALAKIDALDRAYDLDCAMRELDKDITDIIEDYQAGRFANENHYMQRLAACYKFHGFSEREYQNWCQERDERFGEISY